MRNKELPIESMRVAPVGSVVSVGMARYEVERYRRTVIYGGKLCGKCSLFTEGGDARVCPYSHACLGRYREDKESVVFVRIEKGR